MSWLFSQALAAEYSAATCSGGAPSAPLSVMPTPHKFWRNDKTMEPSQLSRFGLTCAVLTEDHGEALLTWFLADSRVRTYQLPGMATASMVPAPGYGVKWRESSARYDLPTSTWKTHLYLWEEDLHWSSVTLPKWGMTRSGALFQHPTLTRPINANASGLWPTITVCGNHNQPGSSKNAGWGLSSAVKQWPTPLASDGKRNGAPGDFSRKSPSLGAMVQLWPTPTASLGSKGGRITPLKSREGGTLIEAVSARTWPTPNASDANKWSNQSLEDRKAKGQQIRLNTAVSPQCGQGGQLNPEWVEWLMGWPIGWTELKPLATDRFREWQQQHSPSYRSTTDAA